MKSIWLSLTLILLCESLELAFGLLEPLPRQLNPCGRGSPTDEAVETTVKRRHVLAGATLGLLSLVIAPVEVRAKSYSQNARNLERLNAGDTSGGSLYDNDPSSPKTRKRRAMTGCKIASARQEASVGSEKECNTRIMGGETDFMLQAMQRLACDTCPYGIREK